MIMKTGTGGCEFTEEIPVMEVSISHGSVNRSGNADVTTSGTGKRRRFESEEEDHVLQLQFRSRRDVDVNFEQNVASTAAERLPETETFISINCGFRETEEMEYVLPSTTSRKKKRKNKPEPNADASRCKPPPPAAAKMPYEAELEEFLSKAEQYEQKRFAEKYNYDIVKDVPTEGRYQWVRLKP